jgi:hypothetical protein
MCRVESPCRSSVGGDEVWGDARRTSAGIGGADVQREAGEGAGGIVVLPWRRPPEQGRGDHTRLWGAMGDVPLDVVYVIFVGAELEMEDTFGPQ